MPAPRQWHKAFVKLPAAWRGLSYFKRSIMQDLWRSSDADCSGRIEIDGDPAQFLVRELDIVARRDRANAVTAVRELIADDGLITIEGTVATIRTERSMSDGRTMDVRKTLDRRTESADLCASIEHRTQPNTSESLNSGPTDRERDRVERERARPPEVLSFRKPLPEPPPDLPPAEPPLTERIVSAHALRYSQLRQGETCKRDYRAAAEIARWCQLNAAVHKTTPAELAMRVVAGLFASDRAGARRWPLSWAANDAAEFLEPPPGVKPVANTREQAEAAAKAVAASKLVEVRQAYADQIKAARAQGDEYRAEILAAERDSRLARLQAQAS